MADIVSEAFELWHVGGVACAMRFGPSGLTVNGYAQVPEALRRWWTHYDECGPLLTPRELSYGPDEDGWVGFGAPSAGEIWDLADLEASVPDLYAVPLVKMQQDQDETQAVLGGGFVPTRIWTLKQLRGEVGLLATNLAAVAAEVGATRLRQW